MPRRTLNGTSLADRIIATNLAAGDFARSLLGDGNDFFEGSAGGDQASGDAGNDALYGRAGDDNLTGGAGIDTLDGGEGNDTLDGGADNDILDGGDGDDVLRAGSGSNRVQAGAGNDSVTAGDDGDMIWGDAGNDTIHAGGGGNFVYAGEGNDSVTAGDTGDMIWGDGGDDTIRAGGGNNWVRAGEGNDSVTAGADGDWLYGDAGDDTITAGDGNNWAYGGEGKDHIRGGLDNDMLYGEAGDDVITDGGGQNFAYGGAGDDRITMGDGNDFAYGDEGHDRIALGHGNNAGYGGIGNDSITGGNGLDQLYGEDGDDTLNAGAGQDQVLGGAGNDLVRQGRNDGTQGQDYLRGGAGTDTLRFLFTQAEWFNTDNQVELARLVTANGTPAAQAGGVISSALFGLNFAEFESLSVSVDGVTLTAADDRVTARADTFNVLEGGSVSGSVVANDTVPDLIASVALRGAAPTPGTFSLSNAGLISFNTGTSFEYLAAGQVAQRSFTYRVTDADGDTGDAVVTLRITGTNDAASISGTSTGAVDEDGTLTASGTLTVADVDAGEARFAALTPSDLVRTYGSFTFNATSGAWSYALNNLAANVQALNAGQVVTDTLTVRSYDTTDSRTITVTVTGRSEGTVIGNPANASVTEDVAIATGQLRASGTLAMTGANPGQASFLTTVTGAVGNLGALTLAANGAYAYSVANSAVQFLGLGQTKVDSFTVSTLDGTTKSINFTINGVNDAATITGTAAGSVTEDSASPTLTATGSLSVTDVDAGQSSFSTTVTPGAGVLGSLAIAAGGAWSYSVANSAVQSLGAGQTRAETFTVTSLDGTPQVITVTINGVNDAAIITGTATRSVTEDSASPTLTATGSLSVTDVDADQSSFSTTVTPGTGVLGSLAITAGGAWTYSVANSAVQFLGNGQTKVETFTVTSLDGTPQVITVTINGVNDAAIMTGTATRSVTEDSASPTLTATGSLSVTDVDAGEASFSTTVTPGTGVLGSLAITAGGAWTYSVANSAVQSLGAGQTRAETFTVASLDGTPQVITVTITGTNDAAIITGTATRSVTEDSASPTLTATGSLSVTDVDAGEASFSTTVTPGTGVLGSLAITAGGAWTYSVANSAVQSLGAGQTRAETFTVASLDGTPQVITVTITGTNDAAIITGTATRSVTEDSASPTLTATGSLSVTDVDAGEASFSTTVTPGTGVLGSLAITAGGAWTYSVANSAVQSLGAGQTRAETFTVTSLDGTPQVITVTITGTNDAAIITGTATRSVTEDSASPTLTATGSLSVTDVDAGEASFSTTVTPGTGVLGSLAITAGGAWTYSVANSAVQFLGNGQTKVETFTVTSLDGTPQVITVTINGVNDAALRIDLTFLTAAQGFIIQGDTGGDQAGRSVSTAGDINGDGFADLIVGAPYGADGGSSAGEAYVVFGGAGGFGTAVSGRQVLDLTTLTAAQGFIIQGDVGGDNAGWSVSTTGDVNGDGFADLIVGARAGNDGGSAAGEAYVLFGGAGGFGTAVSGRQVVDLTTLTAAQGFIIQGDMDRDFAGYSVSTAGDVNGDGFADLIVGAYGGDDGGDNAGEAYVLFGGAGGFGAAVSGRQVVDLSTLTAAQGFIIQGDVAGDLAGRSISTAGDVNGDGFADLIVGALGGDDGGTEAGEAYVLFGGAGGFGTAVSGRQVVDLTTLTAAQGFIIQGDMAFDNAGVSVSTAGDVNGDGFADLIVGAYLGDDGGSYAGEAYVLFGGAGGFGTAVSGRRVVDLTTLTAAQGFIIQGDTNYDTAGFSVSTAGDVNGDGFADLIVGAPGGDDGGSYAGEAYVLFGGAGGFGTAVSGRQVLDLTTLTAAQGFIIQGDVADDAVGRSVSTAGDVNGDGFADLTVGARGGDDGDTNAGEAYVLFGGAFGGGSAPVTTNGTSAAEILRGGAGNDSLSGGGGADVLRGGAGNDRLGVADSAFRSVDGGTGTDTLALTGSGQTLDLTVNPMPRLASIERFDLTGTGNNTLVLDRLAVLGLTEARTAGVAVIRVDGNAGDTVRFTEAQWSNRGSVTEGGVTYVRLVSSDGRAEVQVAAAVAAGFPGGNTANRFDLTTLSAAQGFIIQGDTGGDQAGRSVSTAGDINGDGFADLIVGAPYGADGGSSAGEAYVVFGGAGGFGTAVSGRQVLDLTTLTAAQGFIIQGDVGGDNAGWSVSTTGDVNGDGFADLIVGARAGNDGGSAAGEAYVLFGGAGGFGTAVSGRQVVDLTTLTAAQGFIIQGDMDRDFAGYSVSTAGDVNGDGFADLIVGAYGGDDGGDNAGEAYVLFGGAGGFGAAVSGRQVVDLSTLTAAQGFIIQGDVAGDLAGRSISTAGDVNGDGFADLIVGALGGDDGGTEAGEAYVLFGGAGGFGTAVSGRQVVDLTTLTAAQGFIIQGDMAFDNAGVSVSTAGDVNGDGFADLIVGAYLGDDGGSYAGEAYVLFGGAGGFGTAVSGRRVVDLTTLTAAQGFIIQGDTNYDTAGFSVSTAGDVNGDGFADLIVGAPGGDDGGSYAGEAYVLFGGAGGFGTAVGGRQVLDLTTLTAAQGFIIQGDVADDAVGRSVSTAGDVNGDGFADLTVGARGGDDGDTNAGEAYVLFGGAFGGGSAPVTTNGTSAAEILRGGAGNDSLSGGGGADVLRGGAGNDRLGVADSAFRSVDGGTGTDTLALTGSGQTLDLTVNPMPRLASIERFDLTGTGNNTLVLDRLAVLGLTEARTAGVAVIRVDGNAGDTMRFTEAQWSNRGSVTEGGVTYARLVSSDGRAEVQVDAAVAAGFPGGNTANRFDLTTLTAAQGFIIQGDVAGDDVGRSVSTAGDVNGDGFADLMVGARYGDDGGGSAGEAYVLFGGAGGFGTAVGGRQVVDLTTLTAAQGFIIQGDVFSDNAGGSVSTAGDVNGDGFADLIVGASGGDDGGNLAGEAYVLFGGSGGFGTAVSGRQVVDLTTLTAAQGFIIQGDVTGDQAGWSVSTAGDVNGDGFADLIVGAPAGDDGGDSSGEAYVVFGGAGGFGTAVSGRQVVDLTSLTAAQGFIIQGDVANDFAGSSVSTAGDVNGDGFADMIVGARFGDDGGTNASEAYVVFGGAAAFGTAVSGRQVVDLTTLTATQGFIIQGDVDSDFAGSSVSAAGDVNGDGFADLIVGAYGGDDGGNYAGEAYVVFGGAAAFGTAVSGRQVVDLTTLTATQGFIIQGDVDSDFAGSSVSAAGDVNGDGFADLIVGARLGDDGGDSSGEAYVVFGGAGGFGTAVSGRQVVDLTNLSASQGFIIQGDAAGDRASYGVSTAGDVNGDGFGDLIVGANGGDDGGAEAGEAYVLFGGAFGGGSAPVTTSGTAAAEILRGGSGNDSLSGGGGADVLRGGAGNDRLGVADSTFRSVDGGLGTDTLALTGSGQTLDLTGIGATRITAIERFDLTGTGNNTLVLRPDDVFALSGTSDAAWTFSALPAALVVDGNAGDTLDLRDFDPDGAGPALNRTWVKVLNDVTLSGSAGGAYDVWELQAGTAKLAAIAAHNDLNIL